VLAKRGRAAECGPSEGVEECRLCRPRRVSPFFDHVPARSRAPSQHNGMPPPGYFVIGDGPEVGPKQ